MLSIGINFNIKFNRFGVSNYYRIPEQTNHVKTEPDIDEMVKFINTNEEEAKSLEQADIAKIVHGIEDEFGEMGKDIDILRKEKEAKSILIKKYQRYKILNR